MANNVANVQNVSVGEPAVAGAIYRAPVGTTLPTDASSSLSASFKTFGYISEDGLTNSNSRDTSTVKDWSGADIVTLQNSKTDTFKYKMMEVKNVEVLKDVYGDENVSGDIETGLTIKANAKELTAHAYVIDTLLSGGYLKRIVIPNGKVTEIADLVYKKTEAMGYEVTITALPDTEENTHYEYIVKGEEESEG